jgi:hypothetical protein
MLTDLTKKKWTLGRSIGTGGFGEIYLAQEGEGVNVRDDARSPNISRQFYVLLIIQSRREPGSWKTEKEIHLRSGI